MIDFSKAFDPVDHVILIRKLQALNIPPNFYNWIIVVSKGAKFWTLCQKPLVSIYQLHRALGLDHPYTSLWKVTCIPNLVTTS